MLNSSLGIIGIFKQYLSDTFENQDIQ